MLCSYTISQRNYLCEALYFHAVVGVKLKLCFALFCFLFQINLINNVNEMRYFNFMTLIVLNTKFKLAALTVVLTLHSKLASYRRDVK